MVSKKLHFTGQYGLHMRVAARLAKKCSAFQSEVTIRNIDGNSEYQDAKSVISILNLNIKEGTLIEIQTTGLDERVAIEVLSDWIKNEENM